MRNLLIEPQPCEPAPRQMHAQFLDQFPFAGHAIQVADQQDAQQKLGINMRPSVIKALTTKLETLERLHARDIEHKESETVTENGRLTEELTALKEQWGTLTPEQVRAQAEELRTLSNQCETLRSSNNSYAREIATAKGETQGVTELLHWQLIRVHKRRP
jgi:ATP-dependent Clp protease ATP-binding subunit ClpA